jgi:hypothetical protein
MSIDTTFHPITETYVVDNTVAVQIKGANQRGATTFRVRNISTSTAAYVAWGPTAPAAPVAPVALGVQPGNMLGIPPSSTLIIEVPANSFFIASVVFATGSTGLEITGGIGGVSS